MFDEAVALLRKKLLVKAGAKAERQANDGLIALYVDNDKKNWHFA